MMHTTQPFLNNVNDCMPSLLLTSIWVVNNTLSSFSARLTDTRPRQKLHRVYCDAGEEVQFFACSASSFHFLICGRIKNINVIALFSPLC